MRRMDHIYSLIGKKDGKCYEVISQDVEYLKMFLTRQLRHGGSGFIWRMI